METKNQQTSQKVPNQQINNEANRLIYEKSNSYRIHSDNLRWTLLGAYFVFFAAIINQSLTNPNNQKNSATAWIFLILFFVSICFLLMLSVQNWFYNLFAQYVNECEQRLSRNINLRTMQEFASENGKDITPFHPAFIFALLVVLIGSFLCLYISASIFFLAIWGNLKFDVIFFIIVILITLAFIYSFKHWDKTIYKGLIFTLSNIFKGPSKDSLIF
jgi:hypothetical protein